MKHLGVNIDKDVKLNGHMLKMGICIKLLEN